MTSPSVPERQLDPLLTGISNRPRGPGTLSKVTGAGVGTGLIVLAQKLGLSEVQTLIVEGTAPWISVLIGAVGPLVTSLMWNTINLRMLKKMLAEFEMQAKSAPEGSESRRRAEANLEQLRMMINENLADTAAMFHRRK